MDNTSGHNSSSSGTKKLPAKYGVDLRPSPPISRGTSPFSQPSARSISPAKSATGAGNDSFANLVNFGSGTNEKNLSLAERQKLLAEKKAEEEKQRRAQLEAQYGQGNGDIWNRLETAGRAPSSTPDLSTNGSAQNHVPGDEDDILAAFNASAPVDTSTNFPIPSSSSSTRPNSAFKPIQSHTPSATTPAAVVENDDDDPFGLTQLEPKPQQQNSTPQTADDDDDILGPLAKPVSEFSARERETSAPHPHAEETDSHVDESLDKPIAALVDMGFSVEDARTALNSTESGTDVQAAVGWLLNRAHSESQQKAKSNSRRRPEGTDDLGGNHESGHERTSRRPRDSSTPAWMRGNEHDSPSRSGTPARGGGGPEKDPAQMATEFGNTLFKSANTLWKTGTKRMQQAVQEFNSPADPSQPRWMRNAVEAETGTHQNQKGDTKRESREVGASSGPSGNQGVTNEAMLLEPQAAPPTKPQRSSSGPQSNLPHSMQQPSPRSHSPALSQHGPSSQSASRDGSRSRPKDASASRVTRLGVEEQAAQAYVSPARRRRPGTSRPEQESTPELLEQSTAPSSQQRQPPAALPRSQAQTSKPSKPPQVRPKAPPRSIPPIQPSTIQKLNRHRQAGTEAFKRGDYSTAHTLYSNALSSVPETHPIAIILLTNRALTGLKIGEPKSAIGDAERAISIIGPSRGEYEKIDPGNGEPGKEMKGFFGKALMRKAEALEQLERWTDAAKVWQEAVESGHGGSASIQGRNRCEKAAGSANQASKPKAAPSKPKQPVKRPPAPASTKPTEAVTRLRATNDAADRADTEKFALSDAVDARVEAWRSGKKDNLRALLASLENVLWPEAQWKKINMSELLLPNKVKIQYMKGIAKVHPDKIPVDATTEQKMIAGAVFSTLNEAWEKFKAENGL